MYALVVNCTLTQEQKQVMSGSPGACTDGAHLQQLEHACKAHLPTVTQAATSTHPPAPTYTSLRPNACHWFVIWLQVFEVAVGGSGVSAAPAYVVGWEQVLEAAAGAGGGAAELQLPTDVCPDPGPAASPQQLVVCNTDGTMQVLQLDATGNLRVVQSVMLPGELFSSPVTLGCAIILGCRDDCLYCICRSAVFDPA